MPRVELHRGSDALEALTPEWHALHLSDPLATPFQSPAWLVPWAQAFEDNQPLLVTLRDEGGDLLALLPCSLYSTGAGKDRQLLLLGTGTTDYLDALVHPSARGSAAPGLAQALAETRGLWERAYLTQLPAHSPLLALGASTAGEACSHLLPGQTLPRKVRRSLALARNRAEARGPVRLEAAASSAHASEMFEWLVTLHSARWAGEGEAGVLADPHVLAHHRAALPLLFAAGSLRFYTLLLGTQPIAVGYALASPSQHEPRRWFYYLTGYDPAFHELSPGTLLLAALREEAATEGATSLDLLRGDEPYKQLWGAQPNPTFTVAL